MAANRQEMIEEIAEDLAAEACYADMLAHPETVVDAFDLFDVVPTCTLCGKRDNSVADVGSAGLCATCQTAGAGSKGPAFDDCNRVQHYALCGPYKPFPLERQRAIRDHYLRHN